MHRDILEQIGLNKNEAIIYESLLALGESPLGVVANTVNIHRRNTLDSLKSLVRRGLVFEIHDTPRILYQAVEPNKLLELTQEKTKALERVLPSLQKTYQQKKSANKVFVYRGIEGFKNNLRDILRIGQPLYGLGAKGGWFSPELKEFSAVFIQELKRKKIPHYHLWDAEARADLKLEIKQQGGESRFLPKEFSTDSAIHIFGDHVTAFTGLGIKQLSDDLTLFITVNQKLADSYRVWFQLMWNICKD